MMYFQLEVNETLANAMRAAVELRAEIGKVINEEESRKLETLNRATLRDTYEDIGDIIGRIGDFAGSLLAEKALDEAKKTSDNNNKIS